MKAFVVLLTSVPVLSCANGRKGVPAHEGMLQETSYEFTATIPYSTNSASRATRTWDLAGVVVQLGESVFVHPKGNCRLLAPEAPGGRGPRGMPTGAGFVRAYCNGAWLAFSRDNPTSARWYTWVSRPVEREVCHERGTRNGRQVCLRPEMQTHYELESRSGAIKVRQAGPG